MASRIYDRDLTDFSAFIKNYASDLKKDFNKIVKIRYFDEPFQNRLTILNPELMLDENSELVPKIDIPHCKRRHFYYTRTRFGTRRTAFYMKVTTYAIEDYKGSGLELGFDVINNISAVVESDNNDLPKRKDGGVLSKAENRDDQYPFANQMFDMISFKDKKDGCEHFYYSNDAWEDRLSNKHALFLPLILLPEFLSGDTFRKCNYNPNKKRDPNSYPPLVSREDLIHEEYEVNMYTGNLYSAFTWLDREDDIVSQFVDTRLLRFLANYEIPIWASICANSLHRPIKDHELQFLNKTIMLLMDLCHYYLNSMTSLAEIVAFSFYSALADFEILNTCQACGGIMRNRHNKKYCSLSSEGRDCGKKLRSKNYYIRNQKRLAEYYRNEMRKTREMIKSIERNKSK